MELFDHNPMGFTPDDIARWLLDRLRVNGVLPRSLVVPDLMGYGGIFQDEDAQPRQPMNTVAGSVLVRNAK